MKFSEKLYHNLKGVFWFGPIYLKTLIQGMRLSKNMFRAVLYLAGQGETVYLILKTGNPKKVELLSTDASVATKDRVKLANENGYSIIKIEAVT